VSVESRVPSLASAIREDFVHHFKLPLLLLILIICSAISIVVVTQETRQLISQKDRLSIEQDRLDVEWRNLILEDNTLGENSRIKDLVTEQSKMGLPNPTDEVIVKLQ